MRFIGTLMTVCAFWGTCVTQALAQSDIAGGNFPRTLSVSETFDDEPFDYTVLSRTEKERFTIYRLSYPSPLVTSVPQNNTIPAEYYLPRNVGPDDPSRPAAICLHILNGNYELVRLTCSMLAARGVPAIMFKLPYYGERAIPGGHDDVAAAPDLFVDALSQAVLDVRRTYDLLASRPEVHPQRIGVVGISMGGILGATAAGADQRISRAVLILAGGDLRHMIGHAREARELAEQIERFSDDERSRFLRAIDSVDPLSRAKQLKERAQRGKVLMINAAEDEVVPRHCTEELATALGIPDRVVWLEGLGHYTSMAELPQIMQTTIEFFAEDLPDGLDVVTPVANGKTAQDVLVRFLQQAAAMLTKEPAEGRCHFADIEVSATPEDEDKIEGRLQFIRGSGYRFKLHLKISGLADATLGQGEYPWMASGDKIVYRGREIDNVEQQVDPFGFADPEHLLKLRVAAGAATGLALAPNMLEQWLEILEVTEGDGTHKIRLTLKEKEKGTVDIVLRDDKLTPHQVTFDVAGVKGTATFHGWRTDTVAHLAMFEPPAAVPHKEVGSVVLRRVFSAMFNFAMENTQ
jgi:dienelactone hydrolase